MWLKSSANRKQTSLFHIWTHFNLFWFRFGCAWLWLAEKFLQKWRWLFVVATRLSCKTMCTVPTKQHNCRFLVLKRKIQNMAAVFALFTVVEISRFIGWNVNTLFISICGTIHISNNILKWFWVLFKNVNPRTKRQEKRISLIFKRNIAHLTHRRALRALIIASAERLKSFFVQAKSTWTLCIWTIHVPNENNSAIVIPTISATHCNCSQKCHTCKQQKIDSGRDVWFRGNPGWQLL